MNEELNCIKTTKMLIKSNEIEENQNEDYHIILQIIKKKLLENIKEYSGINLDAIKIYQFFFGDTTESEKNYIDEMVKWMEKS
jgi:radical SAM superfamily enzyme